MLLRKKAFGLGLLFVAAVSLPALAQPYPTGQPYPSCTKPPSTNDSNKAHDTYTAGKYEYDNGDYDRALARFNEAYKLDCTKHELLIIISAAWEKKGDKGEAARALETFLKESQNVPEGDRLTYQRKIERLKDEAAKSKPAPTATPTTTTTSTAVAPPPPPPGGEERGHTVLPWIVTGAGVVGLGIGIAVLVTTPKFPDNCDKDTQKCTQQPNESAGDFQDRQDRAGRSQTQPTIGIVVAAGGGALIVGGLLWHFLEPTGPSKEGKLRVQPTIVPGYGGLSLSRTF